MTRFHFACAVPFVAVVALAAFPGEAPAQSQRLVLPEIQINPEVPKPEITIFIARQELHAAPSLDLRESFVPRIVATLNREPLHGGDQ